MTTENISFNSLGERGYHHTCQHNTGIYCIRFANRNAELRVYLQTSNGKFFMKNINTQPNEDNVCFKLNIPEGLSVDLTTSHKVVKSIVMYDTTDPQSLGEEIMDMSIEPIEPEAI